MGGELTTLVVGGYCAATAAETPACRDYVGGLLVAEGLLAEQTRTALVMSLLGGLGFFPDAAIGLLSAEQGGSVDTMALPFRRSVRRRA